MVWKETFKPTKIDLANTSSADLIKYLQHPNEWYSHMTQHLLRQRKAAGEDLTSIADQLRTLILNPNGKNLIRTFYALDACGGLTDETYRKLLNSKNEHLAKLALLSLTERPKEKTKQFGPQLIELSKTTPFATLRLHLAGICQTRFAEPFARQILQTLAMNTDDANDRFIPSMIWFSYSKYLSNNRDAAAVLAATTPIPSLRRSIYWKLAQIDLNQAMGYALELPNEQLTGVLGAFDQALLHQKSVPAPSNWNKLLVKTTNLSDPEGKRYVAALNTKFGLKKIDLAALKAERVKAQKQVFMVCAACHAPDKNQPGPSLQEISKVYNNKADIIKWIKKPGHKRKEYPQMPGFPNMEKKDLELVAEYLLSLKK